MRLLFAVLALVPWAVVAQPQLGPAELARAKTLLDLSRAELSAEQYALLSGKVAEAETAYVDLTAAAEGAEAAAAVTEGAAAAASTGSRVVLGGAAEVLGLLLMALPSTAHAPTYKEKVEPPKVHAARVKLEEKLKELTQAAQKVDAERRAAAQPKKKKDCMCICGDPKAGLTKRKALKRMLEFECRERCTVDHDFPLGQYSCI